MIYCCELDNETLVFLKGEEVVDQLSVRPLLDGVRRSSFVLGAFQRGADRIALFFSPNAAVKSCFIVEGS